MAAPVHGEFVVAVPRLPDRALLALLVLAGKLIEMEYWFWPILRLLPGLITVLGSGGIGAVLAENLILKQQLLVMRRSRRRAPKLGIDLPAGSLFRGFGHLRGESVDFAGGGLLRNGGDGGQGALGRGGPTGSPD